MVDALKFTDKRCIKTHVTTHVKIKYWVQSWFKTADPKMLGPIWYKDGPKNYFLIHF